MSFSSELKDHLCSLKLNSKASLEARICGMLHFTRRFSRDETSLVSENFAVCSAFEKYLCKLCDITDFQFDHKQLVKGNNTIYSITLKDKRLSCELYKKYSIYKPQNHLSEYLSGVFLTCGSITDPQKDYHLEFVAPDHEKSEILTALLAGVSFFPKHTVRQGNDVLYFKESEQIEDLLTLMGAAKTSLEIMSVKIYKDIRNKVNRITNCETANISKTVAAAATVIEDINYIIDVKGISFIPEELRESAIARIENPDMSLRELSGVLAEKMSRSGLNHRLKKLSDIAAQLRQNNGDKK